MAVVVLGLGALSRHSSRNPQIPMLDVFGRSVVYHALGMTSSGANLQTITSHACWTSTCSTCLFLFTCIAVGAGLRHDFSANRGK